MKVKICLKDITIGNIVSGLSTIFTLWAALYAPSIYNFASLMFLVGVLFTLFVISMFIRSSNDADFDIILDKEFEINNPILSIKKRFMKFKIGDIVDEIDEYGRKQGKIIEINYKEKICRVEWKKDVTYTTEYIADLKISRIENWKERIK